MPGAPHPWIATDAPAQWGPAINIFATSGAGGPARSPDTDMSATNQNYDTMLHWKLAGTIILALVTVFVLQQLGFRFVVAGNVGIG